MSVNRPANLPGQIGATGTRFARPGLARLASLLILLVGVCAGSAPALAAADVGNAATVVREVARQTPAETKVLVVDADVFQDDLIRTEAMSATRIIFKDKTNLVMGENSAIKLTKLVFDPDPSKSRVAVKTAQGVFRWTSGNLPSSSYRMDTPVATIGVRGTTIEWLVAADGTTTVAVTRGQAIVANLSGDSVILNPGEATSVYPVEPGKSTKPTVPGPIPPGFIETERRMTTMVRMADPPAEAAPAAGPGAGGISFTVVGDNFTGRQLGDFNARSGPTTTFEQFTGAPQPLRQSINPAPTTIVGGGGTVFVTPETTPVSSTKVTPTDPKGPVRIGAKAPVTVTIERNGQTKIVGTLDASTGLITGPGSGKGGVSLGDGETKTFTYDFSPTQHGEQSGSVGLHLVDGSTPVEGTVVFTGVGVGPVAGNSANGKLAFGSVVAGDSRTLGIAFSNGSQDDGPIELVGLTLTGADISGPWAEFFTLDDFVPGTVLGPGEEVTFHVTYKAPPGETRTGHAFLTIHTDEGAAFGSPDGNDIVIELFGGTIDIPEPAGLAGLAIGILGLALARRRTQGSRPPERAGAAPSL